MPEGVKYNRVLLKISGEALGGPAGFGLDTDTLNYIAKEIVSVHNLGCEVCVVVGGGNFVRGSAFSSQGGIDRTSADHIGMMGTVMNGLAMQAAIENAGVPTRVQSAIEISEVAEQFIRRRAIRHLEKGRVVVFAAGTGNPYFTTDSAAVLRALETNSEVLLKATKVDGVYDKDPNKHDDAIKYDKLLFEEAISKKLAVMDQTAFTMCLEHSLPLVVLDLMRPGGMARVVKGENEGTLVTAQASS